ncbi:MAG: LysM peptidoglycan-binding domain-containing protein, partial [Gammaproteobacteria bacterium]|nr:LysM peptidoglycan-binding domain-containing protein [Gammaproteobacteria bacterium]
GPREHVVRKGESVSLLAERYQVSPAQLRSANKLKTDVLKIGQVLTVPATTLAGQ